MPRRKILCITTGGSIDKIYSGDFVVGPPAVRSVLRTVKCSLQVGFKELFRKDSLELTDEDRNSIVEAVKTAKESHVIITHGTDTMDKTALAVRDAGVEKTVLFTGALKPAAFKDSDALFNLGAAFAVIHYLPVGTHVCMNGVVFSDLDKLHKDADSEVFGEGTKGGSGGGSGGAPRSNPKGRGRGRGRRGREPAPSPAEDATVVAETA